MNWQAYKDRARELRIRRRELTETVDAAAEALEANHQRIYLLDDQHAVIVSFPSLIWAHFNLTRIELRPDPRAWKAAGYNDDHNRLSAEALRSLADVREIVDHYLAGEIEDLPPSTGSVVGLG